MPAAAVAADVDGAADTSAAEATAAPEARRIHDVLEYRIDGNTVLDPIDIENAVEPFLGPQRTIDEIQQARTALEGMRIARRATKPSASKSPSRTCAPASCASNVVELSVGRLRVTGSRLFSPDRIKDRVPSLREGTVPRYDQRSADIQAVNNSRDRTHHADTARRCRAGNRRRRSRSATIARRFTAALEVNDRYTHVRPAACARSRLPATQICSSASTA